MQFSLSTAIVEFIVFACIISVVRNFIFPKLDSIIKSRQQLIKSTVENQKKAKQILEQAKIESKSIISAANKKSQGILHATKQTSEKMQQNAVINLKINLEKERKKMLLDFQAEMMKEKIKLRDLIIQQALSISKKLIEKEIDFNKHKQIIKEMSDAIN